MTTANNSSSVATTTNSTIIPAPPERKTLRSKSERSTNSVKSETCRTEEDRLPEEPEQGSDQPQLPTPTPATMTEAANQPKKETKPEVKVVYLWFMGCCWCGVAEE
ncbi:hypothetical protein ACA910_008062 [Epithemia clementina (nom. ined.)]